MVRSRKQAVSWKRTTGLLYLADRLVITTITTSALGKKLVDQEEFAVSEESLSDTIHALSEAHRFGTTVTCGMDPRNLFALTRPATGDEADRSPEDLLFSRVGSFEGSLAAGMMPLRIGGKPHYTLVASPRTLAQALYDGLSDGKYNASLVPVPMALAHLATRRQARPRRWKNHLRIFPGDEHGLLVLMHGDTPIAWQLFGATGEDGIGADLEIAMLSLSGHAEEDLSLPGIDGVLYHGGKQHDRLARKIAAAVDQDVTSAVEVFVDAETMGLALARTGDSGAGCVEMFQALRESSQALGNFPIKPALVLIVVTMLSGGWLWRQATGIEQEAAAIEQRAVDAARRADCSLDDVEKTFDRMKEEVEIAEAFVEGQRVYWGEVLTGLAETLPDEVRVTHITGRNPVVYPSNKNTAALGPRADGLTIATDTFIADEDNAPTAAANLTAALRASESFMKYFPSISDGSLRMGTERLAEGTQSKASVTITAKPGTER